MRQNEIEKVDLILENCEVITIEGKHIGDFSIKNIRESIERVACNYISRKSTCDSFSMSIYRDSNIEKQIEFTMGFTGDTGKPFDRILGYKDITSIDISFTDGTEKSIIVPWCEESDYINSYQKAYIGGYGDLYIIIDKEKNIENEDVWTLSEMNDNCIWSLYGCGDDDDE